MIRKVIFQMHLWCGLVIGLFLAFQGVTGSFVAFRHEGNHWLHADEMIVEPQDGAIIPLSQVLESFSESFPDIPHNVLSIVFPQAPDEAYFIRIWDNAPAPNKYASMNPYTGEITGSGSKYQYPFELMFRLHEQVSMGDSRHKCRTHWRLLDDNDESHWTLFVVATTRNIEASPLDKAQTFAAFFCSGCIG